MTEPMRISGLVLAPVDAVWEALTSADAMRQWLAEHAEVDLPHRYEFWGRYTIEGDGPRQRLLSADDHKLRFEWLDTTVEISVTGRGADSTVVTLTQTGLPGYEDMVAEVGPLALMHTFWALAVANLGDYVEGREVGPMTDFTSPEQRAEYLIAAPAQKVYDAITDPAKFSEWFGANVGIEPYVGGRWSMGGLTDDSDTAKVVEAEPGRKFTIAWPEGLAASWELEESGGKTRLTFVQSGFGDGKPLYGAWMGWISGFAELRRFVEADPYQPRWVGVFYEGTPEGLLTVDQPV
jgi:uncharacterized protein YndB with AHSA1/START domain